MAIQTNGITGAELANLPVFQMMAPKELEVLALALRERRVRPDEVLYRQGDRGSTCHVVLQGALLISLNANGTQRDVGASLPGELLGEVALLDGGPRSATVRGGPDGARVGELDKVDFDQVFGAGSPFAYKLMDIVATRMVSRMREAMNRVVTAVLIEDEATTPPEGP